MKVKVVKEIRFAVVMYGGVSLAIYINGVVQELMAMVRSTAVDYNGNLRFTNLSPNETVYREIAFDLAKREPGVDDTTDGPKEIVRFIVDVISGTSAGGINGIFLATGIVGGVEIGSLEKVWLEEGDFGKLLNDGQSVGDLGGIKLQETQLSLLNSERMYFKLLDALRGLDEINPFDGTEALTDEVDLFVTTTDFWGIPAPVRLSDGIITERRHRQHFHFRYRDDRSINDFTRADFPFIAYAARCTSSFPVAFDPMSMERANDVLKQNSETKNLKVASGANGKTLRPAKAAGEGGKDIPIAWDKRQFVDGGYLDNKPFGHAIKALGEKQSDVLVERKLLYIEPKPEQEPAESLAEKIVPPSVIRNTLAAISALPTYETIGDELQIVLDRNKLIARLDRLLSNARIDELEMLASLSHANLVAELDRQKEITDKLRKKKGYAGPGTWQVNWDRLELSEIALQKGQIAYPYYRLRIAAVTDDLARSSTRRAGFDENSEYFGAVRLLVYYWRKQNFSRGERGGSASTATPLQFLRDYDQAYRLRRLRFVLRQADRLLRFDRDLENEIKATDGASRHMQKILAGSNAFNADERRLLSSRFSLVESEIFSGVFPLASVLLASSMKTNRREISDAVSSVKRDINSALSEFRLDLVSLEPDSPLAADSKNSVLIRELNEATDRLAKKVGSAELEYLVGKASGFDDSSDLENQLEHVKGFVAEKKLDDELNKIGSVLASIYNGRSAAAIFNKPRKRMSKLPGPGSSKIEGAVRSFLSHFYENFDAYDQIVFPTTFETPVGEGVRIDVARISPLDAVSLLDENKEVKAARDNPAKGVPRKKLAGDVFFSFGAFFDPAWRKNDILWGRLDGAERMVSLLVPPGNERDRHLGDLQRNIVNGIGNHATVPPKKKVTYEDVPAINRDLAHGGVYTTLNRSLPIVSTILSGLPSRLSSVKSVLIALLHIMLGRPLLFGAFKTSLKRGNRISYLLAAFILMLPPIFAAGVVWVSLKLESPWSVVTGAFVLTILLWVVVRKILRGKLYRLVTGK